MDPTTPKRPRRSASFRSEVLHSPAAFQKGTLLPEETPLKQAARLSRGSSNEIIVAPDKKGVMEPPRFEPIKEEPSFEGIQIDDREEVDEDDAPGPEASAPSSGSSDAVVADNSQVEINGEKYLVRDAAAFNACLKQIAVPLASPAPKRKQARQRSLEDFRRRRLEEKQAEAAASAAASSSEPAPGSLMEGVSSASAPGTPPRSAASAARISASLPCTPLRLASASDDLGLPAPATPPTSLGGVSVSAPVSPAADEPGTPTRARKRRPQKYDEEFEGETVKLRSPIVRSPAVRRALMSLGPDFAVPHFPITGPPEDKAVQLQRALKNFEEFHSLPRGTATEEQVAQSSAGVAGWAGAPPRVPADPAPVHFAGSSIAEEMRLASSASSFFSSSSR